MVTIIAKYVLRPVITILLVTYLYEYFFNHPIPMDARLTRAIGIGLLLGCVHYFKDQYKAKKEVSSGS